MTIIYAADNSQLTLYVRIQGTLLRRHMPLTQDATDSTFAFIQ